jgi:FkbM family methyltransferase
MISYAQNFEDVMLARAFKGQKAGFYIDVGVWQPTQHSVTRHFYDLGWSGINVEPLPANFEAIQQARPRDININAAISTQPGPLVFHAIRQTGLSTSRPDYAAMHARAGFDVAEVKVPTLTLKELCEHHAAGRTIDFLKIDVEGAEADVVASADWAAHRPRILLIEATVPLSPEVSYLEWEPAVLGAGYLFGYFDGLNRWYVRSDEPDLLRAFGAPPNPFDEYRLAQVVELERELAGAQRELQRLMAESGSVRASLRNAARSLARRLR